MGTRFSSDRILSEVDHAIIAAECEERRAKVDPRNIYTVSYTVNGYPTTESVIAYTSKAAEELVKQQCGLVGWSPVNFKIIDTKPAMNVNV